MTTLGLPSGRVTGRLVAGVLDTFDVGFEPNNEPFKGSVTFTPSAPNVAVPNGTPAPALVKLLPYVVPLNELGYLTWQGQNYVELPVATDFTNPTSWSWLVSFQLTYEGEIVPFPSFAINVPEHIDADPSTIVDLAKAVTVEFSPGVWISQGEPGSDGKSVEDVTLVGNAFRFTFLDNGVTTTKDITIPGLAAANTAAADAIAARNAAQGYATTAGNAATSASGSATAAANSAAEAAAYVGGVADGTITTPKIVDGAVTLVKTSAGIQTSLGKADTAVQPAALTTKADLSGGKLLTSQLPDLAIAEYKGAPATQAAMLAITAERGDWVYRSDTGTNFIVIAEPSSTLANWRQLNYPASPVASVAGKTGAVTLLPADITGTAVTTADSRLSDQRVPTANSVDSSKIVDGSVALVDVASAVKTEGLNYDHTLTGARATGLGDLGADGFVFPYAITLQTGTIKLGTADASGNTVVRLLKNGSATGMPADVTITAPATSAAIASGSYSFAANDILSIQIVSVGTTPGNKLKAVLQGVKA